MHVFAVVIAQNVISTYLFKFAGFMGFLLTEKSGNKIPESSLFTLWTSQSRYSVRILKHKVVWYPVYIHFGSGVCSDR